LKKYLILRPVQPAQECYISELLLWRAFGRYPEEAWAVDDDWRFSPEIRDTFAAPNIGGEELTDAECKYAGIDPDPRTLWFEEYDIPFGDPAPPRMVVPNDYSEKHHQYSGKIKSWLQEYEEYIDEFKTEIYLDLRRGNIVTHATKLPNINLKKSEKILEDKGKWFSDIDVSTVPPKQWVTKNIDWINSSIFGRNLSFIWIHVDTSKMLEIYPPNELITREQLANIGDNFALATDSINPKIASLKPRGRPSLPWEHFHVEVTKLYINHRMPKKKEAAIVLLQDWFQNALGKKVSRSAVGDKLKPYFDAFGKKDRK